MRINKRSRYVWLGALCTSLQDQMILKIVDQRITARYRIAAGIVGIKIRALYWLVAVLTTSQSKALSCFVAAFRDQKIRATEASYWGGHKVALARLTFHKSTDISYKLVLLELLKLFFLLWCNSSKAHKLALFVKCRGKICLFWQKV